MMYVLVCTCGYVAEWVSGCAGLYTTKTADRNDLKLGTIVVLDTASKPSDFGFKRITISGNSEPLLTESKFIKDNAAPQRHCYSDIVEKGLMRRDRGSVASSPVWGLSSYLEISRGTFRHNGTFPVEE